MAAGAAAAAVLLWTLVAPRIAGPSLPVQIAATYRAYTAGTIALAVRTSDVAEVEAFFRRSDLGFETRVFDLNMMGYRVEGGSLSVIDGRRSALFAYRGPGGETLLCQMYQADTAGLPAPTRRVTRNAIEFLVYTTGSLTVVFWQEGELVCVLVGEGDSQAILELAAAKAVKA